MPEKPISFCPLCIHLGSPFLRVKLTALDVRHGACCTQIVSHAASSTQVVEEVDGQARLPVPKFFLLSYAYAPHAHTSPALFCAEGAPGQPSRAGLFASSPAGAGFGECQRLATPLGSPSGDQRKAPEQAHESGVSVRPGPMEPSCASIHPAWPAQRDTAGGASTSADHGQKVAAHGALGRGSGLARRRNISHYKLW